MLPLESKILIHLFSNLNTTKVIIIHAVTDEATIASTAAAILIQGNNSFYAAAFVAAVVSMLLPLQHVCFYLFSICAAIVSAFVLLLLQHPYCCLCNICAANDPYPYSYNIPALATAAEIVLLFGVSALLQLQNPSCYS